MTKYNDLSVTRREFIITGIGAGFALAVMPTTAFAVSTPGDGLVAGPVSILTRDGEMPGYRAMPKGPGPFPCVLVIHEIFGVHEYIQDVCRRLAAQGYMAVCPYLYFRTGDVTKIKEIQDILTNVISKTPQAQIWSDLDSTVEWIKNSKHGDISKLGMTGFCWGGGVVWTYSTHNPKVKAGVAWYGKLAAMPGVPMVATKTPLELAGDLKIPVLGLYGAKDKGISQEDVEKMREILKRGQSHSEIIVYPEAEHGFHADYRPSYHEKSAKDGWGKMLRWFKKNGVS